MERRKITPEQAFAVLATTSQNTNRKVAEIAEEIVYTGCLPEPPPASPGGGSAEPPLPVQRES